MFSPIKTFFTYFTFTACIYIAVLLVICGILIFIYRKLYFTESKIKFALISILTIYSATVFYLTVLGRRPLDIYYANFIPFNSIISVFTTMDVNLLKELVVNILMFVPCGFLVSALSKKHKLLNAVLFGICYSFSIEILQHCLSTGYFETDDLLKNTLGAIVGSGLYFVFKNIYRKIKAKLYEN